MEKVKEGERKKKNLKKRARKILRRTDLKRKEKDRETKKGKLSEAES